MTIITNADADLRIDPASRPRLEEDLTLEGQHQDIETEGRRAAQDQRRKPDVVLPFADDLVIEGKRYGGTAAAWVLDDEPDVDETVTTLRARHVVRYEHKPWWPFRPKDARFGLFPVMGPKAWLSIFETGTHCIRCLGQHADFESFPDECSRCSLTADYRNRVIEMMETMRELEEQQGPNRAQRRAMQKREKRTKSGIILA